MHQFYFNQLAYCLMKLRTSIDLHISELFSSLFNHEVNKMKIFFYISHDNYFKLVCKNKIFDTLSDVRRVLFSIIISPCLEKILSYGTDVAIMQNLLFAISYRFGKNILFSFHQDRGFSSRLSIGI